MGKLNTLTKKRKIFLNQIYNIIDNQFKKQEELIEKPVDEIIKELENNSDYIQRIFINSSWGTGKTYFSEAFKEKIEEENKIRDKKIELININAWESDYFSDPMKSIIGEINSYKLLNSNTQKAIEEVMKNLLKAGGKFFLNLILKKFNLKNEDIEQLKSLFNGINTSELEDYKNYKELVTKFKECLSLEKELKVIVIDELDRCKPLYAIELLETVKHFFGVKNIIFVFLVNMEQLKSIISTSYLTQDKCSEYFEKFYDIKFNLPELDYNDFLGIEYIKYSEMEIYKPFSKDGKNFSEDTDKFYEALFLEAFKSNCNGEMVAPRNLIKSFKKFNLLLSSLSLEEKRCFPLMIVLILYFIKEEFLLKNNIEVQIELLYLRTFFEKNNGTLYDKVLDESTFNKEFGYKIKLKRAFLYNEFYNKFYMTLLYKEGKLIEKNTVKERLIHGLVILNNPFTYYIQLEILNYKLIFENIQYFLAISDFYSDKFIAIPQKLLSDLKIDSYYIGENIYNIDVLMEWAKEKYNFTINVTGSKIE